MRTDAKTRAQAIHILKSYLHSLHIPYTMEGEGGLAVQRADGSSVEVTFSGDSHGSIGINAADLLSMSMERVLDAFHVVTEAAGYGRPAPVDHGEMPERRINYRDDFELVYLRHKNFRRTPTVADQETLKRFEPYIKRAAVKAYYRFLSTFGTMGFTEDDLASIGHIHALTYLHNYASEEDSSDVRLFINFLNQRFAELAKLVWKKSVNVTVGVTGNDQAGLSAVSLYDFDEEHVGADQEYEEGSYSLVCDGEEHVLDARNDGYLGINVYIDGRLLLSEEVEALREKFQRGQAHIKPAPAEKDPNPASRYKKQVEARQELHTRLGAMEPEQRELVLSYAALARHYSPDARDVAQTLCEELVCTECHKRVSANGRCRYCGQAGVPRYGIDYGAVRQRLEAANDSLVAGMMPEQRSKAYTKALQSAAASVAAPAPTKAPLPSPQEIAQLEAQMKETCFDSLPAELSCCVCKEHKPKAEFGVRVVRRHTSGVPQCVAKHPRCRSCRRPTPKT